MRIVSFVLPSVVLLGLTAFAVRSAPADTSSVQCTVASGAVGDDGDAEEMAVILHDQGPMPTTGNSGYLKLENPEISVQTNFTADGASILVNLKKDGGKVFFSADGGWNSSSTVSTGINTGQLMYDIKCRKIP